MVDELTPAQIFNEIILHRTASRKPIVIVEGPSDKAVYARCLTTEPFLIIPAFGKSSVLAVMALVNSQSMASVVGIVDSDGTMNPRLAPANVVVTGIHDLDVMVLTCIPVLVAVLLSHTDHLGSSTDLDGDAQSLLTTALSALVPLSALRIYSELNGLGLRFEGLPVHELIGAAVDSLELVRLAGVHSGRTLDCHATLASMAGELQLCRKKPLEVTVGHDLAKALSAIVTTKSKKLGPTTLERSARAAFHPIHFKQTHVFRSLRRWQKVNGVKLV